MAGWAHDFTLSGTIPAHLETCRAPSFVPLVGLRRNRNMISSYAAHSALRAQYTVCADFPHNHQGDRPFKTALYAELLSLARSTHAIGTAVHDSGCRRQKPWLRGRVPAQTTQSRSSKHTLIRHHHAYTHQHHLGLEIYFPCDEYIGCDRTHKPSTQTARSGDTSRDPHYLEVG